jgi:phosphatidylinositol glycan class N
MRLPQIFKIVAPFVFLSAAFATLNARLGMPPFALFLIALSLTDGASTCLFRLQSTRILFYLFGSQ